MKKCLECNFYMREAKIDGQHPFEIGADGRTNLHVHIPTGETGSFLGLEVDKQITQELKARVCPKCGKIELFVDPIIFNNQQ